MRISLLTPRLLPLTMFTMAAVLGVKSAGLLHLGMPAHAETAASGGAEGAPSREAARTVANSPATAIPPPPPAAMTPMAVAFPVPQDGAAPPISTSERTLLLDLRRRRAELEARAQAVAARESLVDAAEKRLTVRLDELDALKQRLDQLEAARKSRAEASWQGLVHIYETMKPKDAAVIFDDLDMPVLVQVMDRMQERKAALVLATMDPERARALTIELADMRSNANKIPDPTPAAGATRVSAPLAAPGALPTPVPTTVSTPGGAAAPASPTN